MSIAEAPDRDRDVVFPDEDLPAGAVIDGALLARDIDEAFDFVVVGSGAAGSVTAHTLAKAGWSVAIVEEGPWVKTRTFKEDVLGTFRTMLRDSGTQVVKGRVFMPAISASVALVASTVLTLLVSTTALKGPGWSYAKEIPP